MHHSENHHNRNIHYEYSLTYNSVSFPFTTTTDWRTLQTLHPIASSATLYGPYPTYAEENHNHHWRQSHTPSHPWYILSITTMKTRITLTMPVGHSSTYPMEKIAILNPSWVHMLHRHSAICCRIRLRVLSLRILGNFVSGNDTHLENQTQSFFGNDSDNDNNDEIVA